MFGEVPAEYVHYPRKTGAMFQSKLDLNCPPWVFVNPEYLDTLTRGLNIIDRFGVQCGYISAQDHPFFQDTREWLAKYGYIKKAENYINGDVCVLPFYFNNILVRPGERFLSGGAMKWKYGKEETYNNGSPFVPENPLEEEIEQEFHHSDQIDWVMEEAWGDGLKREWT